MAIGAKGSHHVCAATFVRVAAEEVELVPIFPPLATGLALWSVELQRQIFVPELDAKLLHLQKHLLIVVHAQAIPACFSIACSCSARAGNWASAASWRPSRGLMYFSTRK